MTFVVSDGPRIEHRDEAATVGIRLVTPFRGMLGVRDKLLAELAAWLTDRDLHTSGPLYLRLHRVDMAADMEIEGRVGREVRDPPHRSSDRTPQDRVDDRARLPPLAGMSLDGIDHESRSDATCPSVA